MHNTIKALLLSIFLITANLWANDNNVNLTINWEKAKAKIISVPRADFDYDNVLLESLKHNKLLLIDLLKFCANCPSDHQDYLLVQEWVVKYNRDPANLPISTRKIKSTLAILVTTNGEDQQYWQPILGVAQAVIKYNLENYEVNRMQARFLESYLLDNTLQNSLFFNKYNRPNYSSVSQSNNSTLCFFKAENYKFPSIGKRTLYSLDDTDINSEGVSIPTPLRKTSFMEKDENVLRNNGSDNRETTPAADNQQSENQGPTESSAKRLKKS